MRKRWWVILLVPVVVAASWTLRPNAESAQANPSPIARERPFIRGVTISCRRSGQAWATPEMGEALDDIHAVGARWMSFHPYGWIGDDGSVRHRAITNDPTVIEPIHAAHERGIKVMVIPHLGYWRSKFAWRGDIRFNDEPAWQRFFTSYTDFIVAQATMAQAAKADLFCLGIEYRQTLHREADWRNVIKAVRRVYTGHVIYAANWDSYQHVPFWDALDAIGIQAYFPLTDTPDPTDEMLLAAWDRILPRVETFARKHKKQVVFTELGYNLAAHAAARPWDHQRGGENAQAIKLRCMQVALSRIEREPWLEGVFLWKWFPSHREWNREYVLQYPEMKSVIGESWQSPTNSLTPIP